MFICLQTRAAHLEVAIKLDPDSVIMVLMRLVGRRESTQGIHSDNGIEFGGCLTELKDSIVHLNHRKTRDCLLAKGDSTGTSILLHLVAEVVPGRACSHLLLVSTIDRVVIDEVLGSCLVEVECILSNKSQASVSSEAKDQPPLRQNSLFLLRVSNGLPTGGRTQGNYWRRWK